MLIAKNIKRLRLDKGLTQEELAEYIGVSGQAVSKWEREECYPDITLLPGLANCFGVSVDELLGMAEIKGKMWNVYAKANTLQNEGKYKEAAGVFSEALKTFPGNLGLMAARAETLVMAGEEPETALEACEQFLKDEMSEKRRASEIALLCFLYRAAGMREKAEVLSRSRPHFRESREFLLPNFLDPSDREEYLHEQLPFILHDIYKLIEGQNETLEEELRQISLGRYQNLVKSEIAINKISSFLKGK